MLAYQSGGVYRPWTGEALAGVRHPLNIEQLWTDAQLAAVGLYRVIPFVAPDGYSRTGQPSYALSGSAVAETFSVLLDPPTQIISDRQFFQALALQGAISQAEALDAVKTGTIPAAMQAYVNTLSGNDRFNAQMLLSGAVEFRRDHPLVAAYAAAMGWTGTATDDLWRFAATL